MNNMQFTPNAFCQLRDFIAKEFGLYFEASKITFLENRVLPFMLKVKANDINEFIKVITSNIHLRREFLDLITTNETWFFRHPRHFDILRNDILPDIAKLKLKQENPSLQIWSAGSSIGAEAYSIAIIIKELENLFKNWNIKIIGSDISAEAIKRAQAGIYNTQEVRYLSKILLNKYFYPVSNEMYKIKPELENIVEFEQLNLLEEWPSNRKFDIIFCRNTMIYFQEETKKILTERFYKVLEPNGILFLSATETLHWGLNKDFEKIFIRGEYIYKKVGQKQMYILYKFHTPADLLKALNTVLKSNIEYNLQSVPQKTPNQPKRAIYFTKSLEPKIEELFNIYNVRYASKETIEK